MRTCRAGLPDACRKLDTTCCIPSIFPLAIAPPMLRSTCSHFVRDASSSLKTRTSSTPSCSVAGPTSCWSYRPAISRTSTSKPCLCRIFQPLLQHCWPSALLRRSPPCSTLDRRRRRCALDIPAQPDQHALQRRERSLLLHEILNEMPDRHLRCQAFSRPEP